MVPRRDPREHRLLSARADSPRRMCRHQSRLATVPSWTIESALEHGDAYAALGGDLGGAVVAGVDVADDAHAGVVGEDPLDLLRGEVGAVGDADLAGVERAADADAAAVVERDPRWRPTRC